MGYLFWVFIIIIMEPVIVPTELPPAAYNDEGCPGKCQDCVRFRDYCYYFSSANNDFKTWQKANQTCADIYPHPNDTTKSSYLASIHDKLEQDFVLSRMGEVHLNRWIGLFQSNSEKKSFSYIDNTRLDYKNWNSQEPTFFDSQTACVLMYGDPPKAGRWSSKPCENRTRYGYVCKVKQVEVKDPSNIWDNTQNNGCLPEFTSMTGACFAVLPVPSNQSATPETVCSLHRGATVAAVTNIRENAFIHTLLAQASNFSNKAKTFLGGKIQNGLLKWDNGCFPKYVNIPNFYSQTTLLDNCLVMESGGAWKTTIFGEKVDFVACETRSFDCERVQLDKISSCPSGFRDECNDFCYRVFFNTSDIFSKDQLRTWADAQADCESRSSSLVSIRSEQDQRCIEKHLEKSDNDVWIGLFYDSISSQKDWKWTDQKLQYSSKYRNWEAGKPSNQGSNGCVEMRANNYLGKWNNLPCNSERGYICEKAKTSEKIGRSYRSPEAEKIETYIMVGTLSAILVIVVAVCVCCVCYCYERHQSCGQEHLHVEQAPNIELQQVPQQMLNPKTLPCSRNLGDLYSHKYEEVDPSVENLVKF